jgi:hypothetical protein
VPAWSGFVPAWQDVASALETLRFGSDADDDAFSDAWRDMLFAHAWHQGGVYPLTARVLPFVFEIVEHSPALTPPNATRAEIATFVLCCAAAARGATHADERAVLAVLAQQAEGLRAWVTTELRSIALATLLNVPELSARVLAGDEAEPRAVLLAILEQAIWLDTPELEWAGRELARVSSHPVAARASQWLLGRNGAVARDDARLPKLAAALAASDPNPKLDALRSLFGVTVSAAVSGKSKGTVTVTDDDWFVVQATRKLTIRWPAHPFAEGDEVLLYEINENNCASAVEGTDSKLVIEPSSIAAASSRGAHELERSPPPPLPARSLPRPHGIRAQASAPPQARLRHEPVRLGRLSPSCELSGIGAASCTRRSGVLDGGARGLCGGHRCFARSGAAVGQTGPLSLHVELCATPGRGGAVVHERKRGYAR